jgi:hypothetical protein
MAWLCESVGLAPLLFHCLIPLASFVRSRNRLKALHPVRFMLVPATEHVYLMGLSRYHILAATRLPPPYHLLRFERYTISKHHWRSITGLQFPTSGNLPLGSSRISRRKHKHLYPRRFRAFLFCLLFVFVWENIKRASRIVCGYAFEDMGLRIDGFSKIMFSFFCVQNSAWMVLLPRTMLPSIAAS